MITQKELKEVLHYDPETGVFAWIKQVSYKTKIGDIAGTKHKANGYIYIIFQRKQYRAHRLAWLYMKGEWPKTEIDHDDQIRDNNKWLNLNEATSQQNKRNQSLRKDNASGVTGVSPCKRKWRAHIQIAGKFIHLGLFIDKFEAICARMSANNKYGFHKNHGRA